MTMPDREKKPFKGPATGQRAFTMVELLTVLLILGIVLALVVGIGPRIMKDAATAQTSSTQGVAMDAVQRYKELKGSYPADSGDTVSLMNALNDGSAPDVVKLLRTLSRDSWAGPNQPLRDGWGKEMRYFAQGGLGGQPLLESAGPDRDFNLTADNVRSDKG